MFGQTEVSFDFRRAMDEGWIVLANLSQEGAQVSAADTALLGRLLLADLWTAAKERGKPRDASQIRPFYVYVDEFQTFVTPTLAENLDQARGFGLHLTMGHQYPSQLSDQGPEGKRVLNSIMANAASKVVFRTEIPADLPMLAQWLFMGTMDPEQDQARDVFHQGHGVPRGGAAEHDRDPQQHPRWRVISSGSMPAMAQTKPIEPPEDLGVRARQRVRAGSGEHGDQRVRDRG